jgi:hypothetical protein
MIDDKALLIEIRIRSTNIKVHTTTQQLLYYIVLYIYFTHQHHLLKQDHIHIHHDEPCELTFRQQLRRRV